jgi:WD40 repeat protein
MKKTALLLCLILLYGFSPAGAQETYFGKNKVQYRSFDWEYIQTEHFDIYFYDGEYELARFAARELEHAYKIVADQLKYYSKSRIPVFIYNSHNDFQQTNIIYEEPTEGTQGFTEAFKKRIVVHFMGSYEDFRHLLHHELTHAVVYDLIYGEFFKAVLTPNRLFRLPLWLAEGYAEYSSNGGWAQYADMVVRDAAIHGYLQPPEYMGMLSYTEGFALVKYIADNYGVDKIGEIFKKGKALLTIDKVLKSSIGMNSEELYEKFAKEMRKRYWPDISLREEPKDFASQLTDHAKDGSNFNEKPVFSPKGQMLAIFTDISGYSEIYLISAIDGKKITRLVKGERSADLESLRWYTSGMSFSPDGENLVFVSKSKGEDALNFLKLKNRKIYLRKKFGLKSIISPAWSPDGKSVVFTALSGPARDLFMIDLETDSLKQLTGDRYDDIDVAWFPDNRRIIFASDRPHPDDYQAIDTTILDYGNYNLQIMDLESGKITPLLTGTGQNTEPAVSPDGERIAFVSNRNGIDNIYIYYVDSARVMAITNVLSNAKSPTWSPDGLNIAYSTFFKGSYDVFVIKDIEVKGKNGVLLPTDFVMGKYDNEADWARQGDDGRLLTATDGGAALEAPPLNDPDFPASPFGIRSDWSGTGTGEGGKAKDEETDSATEPEAEKDLSEDSSAVSEKASEKDKPEEEEKSNGEVDDRYVYNAPVEESIFAPFGDLTAEDEAPYSAAEEIPVDSLLIDSLDNRLPNGEYKVRPYKTKFTPDYISGGLQYDSFFGFQGQTFFVFSDYLGDHQIYIVTDLVNTIDQSNLQFFYLYNKLKIDFGVGLFHTKNYYIDSKNDLFSDRFYGLIAGLSWPRSKYNRIELNTATTFIDRKYYDDPFLQGRNVRVTTAALSWIHDTVLWGITGPVNGRRYKLSIEGATPIFESQSVDYYAGEFDYRQYFPFARPFSFAFRLSGGISRGSNPKNYFLGGSTNKIGSVSVAADVYEVENLYFSSVITPLRGYDYYELVGTRYAVTNMEIRFPFIDYFLMHYPLRLGLSRIIGSLFLDMGAAWSDDAAFKGATSKGGPRLVDIKSGFGFGARANLGFLILRYDLAWRTDFNSVEPHTRHSFSLGADF